MTNPTEKPQKCEWVCDSDGVWQTDCGESWEFINDGPEENLVKYCFNCGRPVVPIFPVIEGLY